MSEVFRDPVYGSRNLIVASLMVMVPGVALIGLWIMGVALLKAVIAITVLAGALSILGLSASVLFPFWVGQWGWTVAIDRRDRDRRHRSQK